VKKEGDREKEVDRCRWRTNPPSGVKKMPEGHLFPLAT